MSNIEQLASQLGFLPSYKNCFGEEVHNSPQALEALINALGYVTDRPEDIDRAIAAEKNNCWLDGLPACVVVQDGGQMYDIDVALEQNTTQLSWQVQCENGDIFSGDWNIEPDTATDTQELNGTTYAKYILRLPKMTWGYHTLVLKSSKKTFQSRLIVTPAASYTPENANLDRVWGIAAQLYSLSSDTSWGIGDFSCLYELVDEAINQGMSAVGLNPLHPLYPSNPKHRSPYSPTSRYFLNTMYIDVQAVPGFAESAVENDIMATAEFTSQLASVRAAEHIDYQAVGALKYSVLRELFQRQKQYYLNPEEPLGKEFGDFRKRLGADLDILATYDALYEEFQKEGHYGWFAWPEEYHDPQSDAVAQFKLVHEERIAYYAWLQWLADKQLRHVTEHAKSRGMAVGLYLDLAVGCDGGGAEVWSNQEAFLAGAAVGAPPDAMNVLGQDWGLTPLNPKALVKQGFEPLAKALRSSMQYAGALRIDHILGFMRQYWVAPGMQAHEGIYIRFPMADMFRIIALESHRNQCVVIGEDLGTVPEGFDQIMADAGLLSYKVLFFERWESGLYKRPELYPQQSMATVSTHDLHTLSGWWLGRDLEWRNKLNLYPSEQMAKKEQAERPEDKKALYAAIADYGLINGEIQSMGEDDLLHALNVAVQKFLGMSNSAIQLIPMEDVLELIEQVNIPGTIDEHPNWKRKLPVTLKEFWQNPKVKELAEAMREVRPL